MSYRIVVKRHRHVMALWPGEDSFADAIGIASAGEAAGDHWAVAIWNDQANRLFLLAHGPIFDPKDWNDDLPSICEALNLPPDHAFARTEIRADWDVYAD